MGMLQRVDVLRMLDSDDERIRMVAGNRQIAEEAIIAAARLYPAEEED